MTVSVEALVASGSQTVGPFFHFGLATEPQLGLMAGPETEGERIRVRIRVFDGAAVPLNDALVELWQADASGHYVDRPDGDDPAPGASFRGWGRLPTNDAGECEFETVRPGPVAAEGVVQAAHINVCLFARGMLRHVFTRFYFEGDPMLRQDPVLELVPEVRRTTLIAKAQPDAWTFDIRLQGPLETVFFDL